MVLAHPVRPEIPANYTFRQKGKPVSEVGSVRTLTLQKSQTAWRITGSALGEIGPAQDAILVCSRLAWI